MHALDAHPQRQQAVDAMLEGRPDSEIAKWLDPPLSTKSLYRYRKGPLKDAMRKAEEKRLARQKRTLDLARPQDRRAVQKAVAEGEDPLIGRLVQRKDRRDRWISGAEKQEDYRALASLDRTEFQDIEFEAKLTGQLDNPASVAVCVMLLPPTYAPATPRPASCPEIIDVSVIEPQKLLPPQKGGDHEQ